jgi:hypothetical protein
MYADVQSILGVNIYSVLITYHGVWPIKHNNIFPRAFDHHKRMRLVFYFLISASSCRYWKWASIRSEFDNFKSIRWSQ